MMKVKKNKKKKGNSWVQWKVKYNHFKLNMKAIINDCLQNNDYKRVNQMLKILKISKIHIFSKKK